MGLINIWSEDTFQVSRTFSSNNSQLVFLFNPRMMGGGQTMGLHHVRTAIIIVILTTEMVRGNDVNNERHLSKNIIGPLLSGKRLKVAIAEVKINAFRYRFSQYLLINTANNKLKLGIAVGALHTNLPERY